MSVWFGDDVDLFVPDGSSINEALVRSTDLGVGAHPDDIELLMPAPLVECHGCEDRWFTGVVCTDGAGGERCAPFSQLSDAEYVSARRDEQRQAAELGGYSAMVQLSHDSSELRDRPGVKMLAGELTTLLEAVRPHNVYTHDLADAHATHVAVGLAVIEACRNLDHSIRPARVVGCEGWRGLDWLADGERIAFELDRGAELVGTLVSQHASQLAARPFDSAVIGRRRANATFASPDRHSDALEVQFAMDLTPLIRNEDLDPVEFVEAAIARFSSQVTRGLRALMC